jgi:hypothetical protein
MGKIKQALIEFEEQRFNAKEHSFGSRDLLRKVPVVSKEEWVKHGMANQQDWAQYEAEFNAWLDAYEKSFGTREDLS